MESDDDVIFLNSEEDEDSGNVSSGEDDDDDGLGAVLSDNKPSSSNEICSSKADGMELDEYPFQIMTTEEVVQYMIDCIKDVNTVVLLPPTITRILLNYFKWDKEKLYEA